MDIRLAPIKQFINEALELYNYYIKTSTATFHTESITIDEFESMVIRKGTIYEAWAILVNDVFAGYASIFPFNPRQAYMRTAEIAVYISPNMQRKNASSYALLQIEKTAYERGIRNILAKITAENIASDAFFSKKGYILAGTIKNAGEKFGKVLSVHIRQKELDVF
jgi:phosphinothricin acetyltransferase